MDSVDKYVKKQKEKLLSEIKEPNLIGDPSAKLEPENLPESKPRNLDDLKKEIKNLRSGGKVSSASKRADGIAIRGKTRA